MNFQEIYDQIVFELYGDSIPNNSMIKKIRGTGTSLVNNGYIAQAHRRFQGINNFWFMQMTRVIQLQIGIQSYVLNGVVNGINTESNVKEIIALVIKKDDKFRRPLAPLRTGVAQNYYWPKDGEAQQFPECYEMFGDELVIYPDINESNELHFIYYGYADRPPVNDDLFSQSLGDAVTMYAGEIIVQMVVAEVARILKDYDLYKIATDNYNKAIYDLKYIDNRKRHSLIEELPYIDC